MGTLLIRVPIKAWWVLGSIYSGRSFSAEQRVWQWEGGSRRDGQSVSIAEWSTFEAAECEAEWGMESVAVDWVEVA